MILFLNALAHWLFPFKYDNLHFSIVNSLSFALTYRLAIY